MKVIFANDSLAKLKFLALSDETGSGFLRTERIGKYILITDLITGDICKDSIKKDLMNVYNMWGSDFGGIFMKGDADLIPDFFEEKMVLKIRKEKYRVFYCNSEKKIPELVQEGSFN
ncbi:MAG: hypothetical protein ABFR36_10330 [Acidobacteriota bacterium]